MPYNFTHRLKEIQSTITANRLDWLLVSNPTNIYYLTGLDSTGQEREFYLLVGRKYSVLIVPTLYELEATQLLLVQESHLKVEVAYERQQLLDIVVKTFQENDKVGLEAGDLSHAEFLDLRDKLKSLEQTVVLKRAQPIIEKKRLLKDKYEISLIKKAANLTDKTWQSLIKWLQETDLDSHLESDISWQLNIIQKELSGEGWSFTPIVAASQAGAKPHYFGRAGAVFKVGQPLLVDIGVRYQKYTGDMTRCLYWGQPSPKYLKHYKIVRDCLQMVTELCKPGISANFLHQKAVEFFAKHSLADFFVHSLGHGVGLDIHEGPRLGKDSDDILQEGMIITLEPGLYFADQYGIRIEDMVRVTRSGIEILSKSSKDLVILDSFG